MPPPFRLADVLLFFKAYWTTFLLRIVSFLSSTSCLSYKTLLILASRVASFDLTTPLVSRFLEIERIEYSALAAFEVPVGRSLLFGLMVSHY